MKALHKVTILVLLVANLFKALPQSIAGFRGVPWGTPPSQVRSEFGEPDTIDSQTWAFNMVRVGAHSARMIVGFRDNGPAVGIYRLNDNMNSPAIFRDLRSQLTRLYGQPVVAHEAWQPGAEQSSPVTAADVVTGVVELF